MVWEGLKGEYCSQVSEGWRRACLERPSSVLLRCYPGGAMVLPTPLSIVTLHLFVNQMSAKTDIRLPNHPVSCFPAHSSGRFGRPTPGRQPGQTDHLRGVRARSGLPALAFHTSSPPYYWG